MRIVPDEKLSERDSHAPALPSTPAASPRHPQARRKARRGHLRRDSTARVAPTHSASKSLCTSPHAPPQTPQRRCLLSGVRAPAAQMIRLALDSSGAVAPDILGKAPGRGAWIAVDQSQLNTAIGKGKLRAALARNFKDSSIIISDDLAERVATQLRQAVLARLGLEARAGFLITGNARLGEAIRKGKLAMLLHAADAATDSKRKLAQLYHNSAHNSTEDSSTTTLPADRESLSLALGRGNIVHIGIVERGAAARVRQLVRRWQSYIGDSSGDSSGDSPSDLRDDSSESPLGNSDEAHLGNRSSDRAIDRDSPRTRVADIKHKTGSAKADRKATNRHSSASAGTGAHRSKGSVQ